MNTYFSILKERMDSGRFLQLAWAWHIFRLKKFFRIGFLANSEKKGPKIDIVIPTISKDFVLLNEVISGAKKNLRHEINKVFIVSRKDAFLTDFCTKNGYHFIDELSVLGYGKDSIKYFAGGLDRSGWMFQQLLKLSGDRFVEMDSYVVIDSDTVLINPHLFIDDGRFVFIQSEEWHEPYFKSFAKLFGYKAPTSLSYTSHMMVFNKNKLKLMKKELEEKNGISWDKAYSGTANPIEMSCISDYDTYANWVRYNFPNEVKNAVFYNTSLSKTLFAPLDKLTEKYGSRYKSLSFHSYIS